MKKSKSQIIRDMADEGFGKLVEEYSGRGMYGATCLGLIIDQSIQSVIEEAASRGLRGASSDNMGKQNIVYWPAVK